MVVLERAVFITLRAGAVIAILLLLIGFFIYPPMLWAGAVIMMVTPLTRVLIAGICLVTRHEYAYFVMAAYVLSILVITILIRL